MKTKCIYVRVQTGTDRYEDFTTTKEHENTFHVYHESSGSLVVAFLSEAGLMKKTAYAAGQWLRVETRYCQID